MSAGTESANIASVLDRQAQTQADRTAVCEPDGEKGHRKINFKDLCAYSNRLADGLVQTGIRPGMRVLLMVTPGIDFIALTFALFKTGAVPVLIDPGLGWRNLLQGIEEAEPEALIGIPRAHLARLLFPKPFRSVRLWVTVGKRWGWGGKTLAQIERLGCEENFRAGATRAEDLAAILFTSGSTGPAKGVVYTHAMFLQQVEILRTYYNIRAGEIELSTFPLFALFAVGMGMTCVIPRMDFTRPAHVDPQHILRAIEEFRVTSSFGSPALWNTVTLHCLAHGTRLPSLKRILMAGAPVPGGLIRRFETILEPDAQIHTPYGATECLPVASIERREILGDTWERTMSGEGVCVGHPLPGVHVNIIAIDDNPIDEWKNAATVTPGEIGEIAVHCAWVSAEYFRRERATRLAKIRHDGKTWHRMGDVGRLDSAGRLWFCGRKSQRVVTSDGTRFTIPCEAIFNCHADVSRSALVGIGAPPHQRPAIVIETKNKSRTADAKERERFRAELLTLAQTSPLTRGIADILFHPAFPVDIRHNAKIFREKLATWAAGQLP